MKTRGQAICVLVWTNADLLQPVSLLMMYMTPAPALSCCEQSISAEMPLSPSSTCSACPACLVPSKRYQVLLITEFCPRGQRLTRGPTLSTNQMRPWD